MSASSADWNPFTDITLPPKPLGAHWLLDLFGCPAELLNDMAAVESRLRTAIEQARFTLLKIATHQYEPQGVTAIALVAESHLAIHTWPEHGHVAIDFFTCGNDAGLSSVCDELIRQFGATKHSLMVLKRGDLSARRISVAWAPPS